MLLTGDGDAGLGAGTVPAVSFMIGMFPQRGIYWITERIKILSPKTHEAVRELPLDMIEGVEVYDKIRLQ